MNAEKEKRTHKGVAALAQLTLCESAHVAGIADRTVPEDDCFLADTQVKWETQTLGFHLHEDWATQIRDLHRKIVEMGSERKLLALEFADLAPVLGFGQL